MKRFLPIVLILALFPLAVFASYEPIVLEVEMAVTGPDYALESDPNLLYNFQETYINPVIPGDHPDPSLFKMGDDFYSSGSCFHFTPYSPILHSKDLVHWEVVSRVVPSTWSGLNSSAPAAGIWGGTLTYINNTYYLERTGTKLAEIFITSTGSTDTWKNFSADISDTLGQHDLFFRFKGPKNAFYLNTVQMVSDKISSLQNI